MSANNFRHSKSWDDATGSCVDGNGNCSPISFAKMTQRSSLRFAVAGQSLTPLPLLKSMPPMKCQYAQPVNPPDWLTTAFWYQDDAQVGLLNGFRRGEISLYNLDGQLQKRIDIRTPLEGIARYQKYFLTKGSRNDFYLLNNDLTIFRHLEIPDVSSLYPGWSLNGNEIVGYGAIKIGKQPPSSVNPEDVQRGFQLGFISINLDTGTARLIRQSESNDFYRVNWQYVATADGTSYFLAIESKLQIFKVSRDGPAPPLINSIPKEFLNAPKIQLPQGEGTANRRFAELESLHMPVGLYSSGHFLYLLTRDPEACSPWSLHKIDPVKDRIVGHISIPSLARHITLVPGDRHWLVIEKGAVEAAGYQKLKALKAIPSSWFTEPSASPLKHAAKFNRCVDGD